MNKNDFRHMNRGKQLSSLAPHERQLLEPINQRGDKYDKALLLLHGFSSSPAAFRYLIPALKNYDAIVCPALPGHGESIEAFSRSKSDEWYSSAKGLCKELVDHYQQVDVLGLSLGGLLACELSKEFNLHHLFLLAPALKLNLNSVFMLKLAKLLKKIGFTHLRNAAGNLLNEDITELSYRKIPITVIIEILHYINQYQWLPPTCPTDLFLGNFDAVVSSSHVAQLFSSLPNAKIHWLKNSAHVLSLDNDKEEIIRCINATT